MTSAIELTKHLVRMNTINPPGDEEACAKFLGNILEDAGFSVFYFPLGEKRASLVARIGGNSTKKPLCITGHIDTVPLGSHHGNKIANFGVCRVSHPLSFGC